MGRISEAKRMAHTIRLLLHDTDKSTSLLSQLGFTDTKFYDSIANTKIEITENMEYAGGWGGLIRIRLGPASGYAPFLDESPTNESGYTSFEDYWNRTIFKSKSSILLTRKEIILAVANKDGGSHVDPELGEDYAQLSRENSMGWMTSSDNQSWNPVQGAELAAVRQIAHEVLKTLIPNYPFKKMILGDIYPVIGSSIKVVYGPDDVVDNVPSIRRQGPCPCNSGKKYKRCCEKKILK